MGGSSPSGNTTTTQVSSPWSGQQPYLTQGFQSAQNLFYGQNADGSSNGQLGTGAYNPQYFGSPGTQYAGQSTVSPFTANQTAGFNDLLGAQQQNNPSLSSALNMAQNNTTQGQLYNANPSNSLYGSAAYAGYSNPSLSMLSPLATGQAQASNGGNNLLSGYATGSSANPGAGYLNEAASGGSVGNSALEQYASGSMLGSQNPAWQQLSDSVAASTLPGLEAQFSQGGSMNNPNAAYAVSSGLAGALAPYAEQNYNTQTQNQLSAAGTLAGNTLSAGATLGNQGLNAASNLASNILGGQGLQETAANNLGNQYQNAVADQLAAAQGLSNNYNTANTQGIQTMAMLPGLASANTTNAETQYQVGAQQQQQAQNELNNTVNMWNYNQNLPLNLLNAYQSATSGSYGGTSSLTSPYYQNSTANAMGLGLGGISALNGLNSMTSGNGLMSAASLGSMC